LAIRLSFAFGVYEEHQKDLLKMISNSSSNYKKMIAERTSKKSEEEG
jgi:hypothetical protein